MLRRILLMSVALMATLCTFAQDVTYLDANGKSQTLSSGRYETISSQKEFTNGWYVLDNSLELSGRVTVSGTAHLILKDGCTLTIPLGIQLKEDNSLTIYGQGKGTGKLTTGPCNEYQAGIGGNNHERAGTLVVNGGNVEARGGYSAAGIGGGAQGHWAGNYGNGGTVVINGGTVYAKGNHYGAGIGGGGCHSYNVTAIPGEGGSVTINGGNVTAIGGDMGGYGIGPGRSSGNEGEPGTLSLAWRDKTDRIYMSSVKATITLNSEFVYEDTKEMVTADNLNGRTIIPPVSLPNPKVKGDVNGDGNVDISDVVAVINQIAGIASFEDADVNGDTDVDISDIVAIINIIANGGSGNNPPVNEDPAVKNGWCPDTNHPHIIDMGTAGKWSCCNVGASNPLEYGGYYAWGETEEKDYYSWGAYLYCEGSSETVINIGKDISGTDYDVAHYRWRGNWCMPNHEKASMLLSVCLSEWISVNGVYGQKLTASNGGTIFLPAAGFQRDDANISSGTDGYYCLSTANQNYSPNSPNAYSIHIDINGAFIYDAFKRNLGGSVRPVFVGKDDMEDLAVASGWCPDSNHPHIIDMGPAGKWSCCNVGASNPLEIGGYYAWGETEEKDYYDLNTYSHCDGSNETMRNIGNDIAGTDYDVAHVKWGGQWQMPNQNQIQALLDNCKCSFVTVNGVKGQEFSSPGKGILFLPVAGERFKDLSILQLIGHYWLSTMCEFSKEKANEFYFTDLNNGNVSDQGRQYGLSVRPVIKE